MRLRGSVIGTGAAACAVLLSLSSCAQNPIARAVDPGPFGYMKRSSFCQVGKINVQPSGKMDVDMKTGSDDGLCSLSLEKSGGGNYASFGVDPMPDHGHVFMYSYGGRTYLDYTADTAYSGPDQFGVILIPGKGQPRRNLTVKVTVEAVGAAAKAAAATAPVAAAAPVTAASKTDEKKAAVTTKKAAAHKAVTHRRVVKKKA